MCIIIRKNNVLGAEALCSAICMPYSGSLLVYYTVLLTHSFLSEGSEFHWLC